MSLPFSVPFSVYNRYESGSERVSTAALVIDFLICVRSMFQVDNIGYIPAECVGGEQPHLPHTCHVAPRQQTLAFMGAASFNMEIKYCIMHDV